MLTPATLRAAFPPGGLFAGKGFLLSPEPLRLDAKAVESIEKLGHRLLLFQRACNELYLRSARGKAPAWVADYLDRGKPQELLDLARTPGLRDALPAVIRPDLLVTPEGFAITELDSVPGGIGLTACLAKTYAAAGFDIVGGADGMLDGFASVLGTRGDILISEESATYRPEMQWLADAAAQRGHDWRVRPAENAVGLRERVYRFFELFDLPNIPGIESVLAHPGLTPPPKPWLEEKLWLALFWMRPLREFWRRELRENHWLELQKFIPQSWVVDPTPLPHHAVIPGLEINDWNELAEFSQKQRDLVLKVSGFSPQAWGSRGVVIGSDVPQSEWAAAVNAAVNEFPRQPRVLMRFAHTRIVEHPFFDADGTVRTMRGRVRLCPYFFVSGGAAKLGGILATIVPADKKLVHGMSDAILVPVAVA